MKKLLIATAVAITLPTSVMASGPTACMVDGTCDENNQPIVSPTPTPDCNEHPTPVFCRDDDIPKREAYPERIPTSDSTMTTSMTTTPVAMPTQLPETGQPWGEMFLTFLGVTFLYSLYKGRKKYLELKDAHVHGGWKLENNEWHHYGDAKNVGDLK